LDRNPPILCFDDLEHLSTGNLTVSSLTTTGDVTANVGHFNSLTSNLTADLSINPGGTLGLSPGSLTSSAPNLTLDALGNLKAGGSITANNNVTGVQLISTTAGAPLQVASSVLVPNLNAQFLNGNPSSNFLDTSGGAQVKTGGLTVNGGVTTAPPQSSHCSSTSRTA